MDPVLRKIGMAFLALTFCLLCPTWNADVSAQEKQVAGWLEKVRISKESTFPLKTSILST
jgi:hypothetical protein